MALSEPQIIDVSLQGLDTKTDPIHGRGLGTAANCYMERSGELRTRKGIGTAYPRDILYKSTAGGASSTGTLSAAYALYADPRGLNVLGKDSSNDPMGGYGVYSLIDIEGAGSRHWQYMGRRSPIDYTLTNISKAAPALDFANGNDVVDRYESVSIAETTDGTYTYRAVAYVTTHGDAAYVDLFRIGTDGSRRLIRDVALSAVAPSVSAPIRAIRGVGCEETGGAGLIVFYLTHGDQLRRWVWVSTSPTSYTRATETITTDTQFDVCKQANDDTVICQVYQDSGATWVLRRIDYTGSTQNAALSTTNLTNTTGALGLYSFVSSGTVRTFLAHCNATNSYVTTFDSAGTQLAQNTVVANQTAAFSAIALAPNFSADSTVTTDPALCVAYTFTAAGGAAGLDLSTQFLIIEWDGSLGSSTLSEIVYNSQLVTKGFSYSTFGPPMFVLANLPIYPNFDLGAANRAPRHPADPSHFLVSVQGSNIEEARPRVFVEARLLTGVAHSPPRRNDSDSLGQVWDVVNNLDDENVVYIPNLRQQRVAHIDANDLYALIGTLEETFSAVQTMAVLLEVRFAQATDTAYRSSVGVQDGVLLGGGLPQIIAEDRLFEVGFSHRPYIFQNGDSGSGAVTFNAGVHQWVAVYEWAGPDGRIYRSAPSNVVTATLTNPDNSQNIQVQSYTMCEHENKARDTKLVLYRTDADGTVFYRVDAAVNDVNATWVTIADAVNDATAIQQEQLFTTGGELEPDPPASMAMVVTRDDRVFYVSRDNPRRIYYSKPIVRGIGVEFSDTLFIDIDAGGDIVALAIQDEAIIAFKKRFIYYVTGDGPNAAGVGEFSPPRLIATADGCVDPRSVVTTNTGTFYKGRKGVYLLDRSLNTSYIGAPAENFNSSAIIDALVLDKEPQVRFLLESPGTTLVYDYYHQIWTSFSAPVSAPNSQVVSPEGDFFFIQGDGTMYKETSSAAAEDMTLLTNWLRLSTTLQGENHVSYIEILGTLDEAFTVTLYKDYEATSFQTVNFTTVSDRKQVRIKPSVGRLEALRIAITQSSNASVFRVSSIAVLVTAQMGRLRGLGSAASA